MNPSFFTWPQCSSSLNREQVQVLIGVNHSMLPGWSDKTVHYCWSLSTDFQLGNWKELQVTSVFLLAGRGIQNKQRTKATHLKGVSSNSHITKRSVCFTSSVFTTIGDLWANPNPTEITRKSLNDSMNFETGPKHLILLSVFRGAEHL